MTEAFSLDEMFNASPYEKLIFSIRSPKTKETLIRRLKAFFRFVSSNNNGCINLDKSMSFENQCNTFVEKSKQDNQWCKKIVIKYLMDLKGQYDEKKLSADVLKIGKLL